MNIFKYKLLDEHVHDIMCHTQHLSCLDSSITNKTIESIVNTVNKNIEMSDSKLVDMIENKYSIKVLRVDDIYYIKNWLSRINL